MARLSSHVFVFLSLLYALANASPTRDTPTLKQQTASIKPLARRAATGYAPRHLRPVYDRESAEAVPRFERRQLDTGAQIDPQGKDPQPVRGAAGVPYLGPHNPAIDLQNLDGFAGPPTDAGNVVNLKWSMGLGKTRLLKGGWVREQLVTDLPSSKDFAAAELRLGPNAYRELHWHRVAEWAYVLGGSGRVVAIDEDGKQFVGDIYGPTNGTEGDTYVFPEGVPHSIQAFEDGLELLLIFSDGNFESTGTTFMLSDWLVHTPLEVLAQNFQLPPETFVKIPKPFPYIFPPTVPPPQAGEPGGAPEDPLGEVSNPYVFRMRQQERAIAPGRGGWTKLQTSATNFKPSAQFASNFVYIEPKGLRELHWNNFDEWIYIISGTGRATAFPGGTAARTFDFQAGDTGVFPVGWGHYMKNTSPDKPLIYLELWKAERFIEFTATQWLSLMPPQHVADLLNISVATVEGFKKDKQVIIKG